MVGSRTSSTSEPGSALGAFSAADLALLRRATGAARNGVNIAGCRQPDDRIVFVNDGFAELPGYEPHGVLGRPLAELGEGPGDVSPPRRLPEEIVTNRRARDGFAVGRDLPFGRRRTLLCRAPRLRLHGVGSTFSVRIPMNEVTA